MKRRMLLIAALCLLAAAFCAQAEPVKELNVALYELLPFPQRVQTALEEAWQERHPDIALQFSSWNGYDEADVPEDLDVFVFDSVYLNEYLWEGCLLPLPEESLEGKEDFFPWALEACRREGTAYALPLYLCTEVLITRSGDEGTEGTDSIPSLFDALGASASQGVLPDPGEGLLWGGLDGRSRVCVYLQAYMDAVQQHFEAFPEIGTETMPSGAQESLRMLMKMAGPKQVNYTGENPYIRALWFRDGIGRVLIGYTENLTFFGDAVREARFRRFSMTDGADIPVFYADLAGINSQISEDRKALALELLNLLTGTQVQSRSLMPSRDFPYPQYVLTARKSVYDALSPLYPAFSRLLELVSVPEGYLFVLDRGARQYVEAEYPALNGLFAN